MPSAASTQAQGCEATITCSRAPTTERLFGPSGPGRAASEPMLSEGGWRPLAGLDRPFGISGPLHQRTVIDGNLAAGHGQGEGINRGSRTCSAVGGQGPVGPRQAMLLELRLDPVGRQKATAGIEQQSEGDIEASRDASR